MLQGEEDVVGVFTCKAAIRSVRGDFAGVINKKNKWITGTTGDGRDRIDRASDRMGTN